MRNKGAKLSIRTAVIIILLLIALAFSVWMATAVEEFSKEELSKVISDVFGLM